MATAALTGNPETTEVEYLLPEGPAPSELEDEVRAWASCKGSPLFASATVGDLQEPEFRATMDRVCGSCAVRSECREFGDSLEGALSLLSVSEYKLCGIYGGEGPRERKARRAQSHQGQSSEGEDLQALRV